MSKRFWLGTLLGMTAMHAIMHPVYAQDEATSSVPPRTSYIFNSADNGRVSRLGVWGNGEASLTKELVNSSSDALKVKTLNFYEGARFDLTTPIDLTNYQRNGYVRVKVQFRAQRSRGGFGRGGGMPGMGMPGMGGPGMNMPGMGAPGMGRGMGAPGMNQGDNAFDDDQGNAFPGGGFPGGGAPGGGFPGGGFPGGGFPGGINPGVLNGIINRPASFELPAITGAPKTERAAQMGLPAPNPPGMGVQFPGGGVPGMAVPGAGMPGMGMPGAGMPGMGMPGMPGAGIPGMGMPGMGMPGMGMPVGPPPQNTDITRLRIALIQDKGATVGSVPVDLRAVDPDDEGWRSFYIPVSSMRSTAGASGPVRRVILSGDKEDTFYVAQLALVVETDKMQVTIRQPSDEPGAQVAEITVKPGQVTLVADVEAGTAEPIIEWNFDADNVGNLNPIGANNGMFGGVDEDGMGGPGMLGQAMPGAFGAQGAFGGQGGFGAPGAAQPGFGNVRPGMPGGMMPGAGMPGGMMPGAGMPGGMMPGAGMPGAGMPGGMMPGAGMPGMDGGMMQMGPRVDAKGTLAKFTYPDEEQNYRVEVTVRDRSGKKPQTKASIIVKVRG